MLTVDPQQIIGRICRIGKGSQDIEHGTRSQFSADLSYIFNGRMVFRHIIIRETNIIQKFPAFIRFQVDHSP
jgi:hypothetical protein